MYISNFTLIHKSIRHIEFICFRHTSIYLCIYIPKYISPDMLGQECLATDCLSILNFLGLSVCFFFYYFSPAQQHCSPAGQAHCFSFTNFFQCVFLKTFSFLLQCLCVHTRLQDQATTTYYYNTNSVLATMYTNKR